MGFDIFISNNTNKCSNNCNGSNEKPYFSLISAFESFNNSKTNVTFILLDNLYTIIPSDISTNNYQIFKNLQNKSITILPFSCINIQNCLNFSKIYLKTDNFSFLIESTTTLVIENIIFEGNDINYRGKDSCINSRNLFCCELKNITNLFNINNFCSLLGKNIFLNTNERNFFENKGKFYLKNVYFYNIYTENNNSFHNLIKADTGSTTFLNNIVTNRIFFQKNLFISSGALQITNFFIENYNDLQMKVISNNKSQKTYIFYFENSPQIIINTISIKNVINSCFSYINSCSQVHLTNSIFNNITLEEDLFLIHFNSQIIFTNIVFNTLIANKDSLYIFNANNTNILYFSGTISINNINFGIFYLLQTNQIALENLQIQKSNNTKSSAYLYSNQGNYIVIAAATLYNINCKSVFFYLTQSNNIELYNFHVENLIVNNLYLKQGLFMVSLINNIIGKNLNFKNCTGFWATLFYLYSQSTLSLDVIVCEKVTGMGSVFYGFQDNTITILNGNFTNLHSDQIGGFGYLEASNTVVIANSNFYSIFAVGDGAIVYTNAISTSFSFTNCNFYNISTNNAASILFALSMHDIVFVNCTFNNLICNQACLLYASAGNTIRIKNCSIENVLSKSENGLISLISSKNSLEITLGTFIKFQAADCSFYNSYSFNTIIIDNCTFSKISSDNYAAIICFMKNNTLNISNTDFENITTNGNGCILHFDNFNFINLINITGKNFYSFRQGGVFVGISYNNIRITKINIQNIDAFQMGGIFSLLNNNDVYIQDIFARNITSLQVGAFHLRNFNNLIINNLTFYSVFAFSNIGFLDGFMNNTISIFNANFHEVYTHLGRCNFM